MNLNESFCLNVTDLYNNNHQVYCFGYNHSVEYVKFVLGILNKVERQDIILCMNDKELLDCQTFKECNINENSKIRMYFRLKSGFW